MSHNFGVLCLIGLFFGIVWSIDIVFVKYVSKSRGLGEYPIPTFAKALVAGSFIFAFVMFLCWLVCVVS